MKALSEKEEHSLIKRERKLIRPELNLMKWLALFDTSKFKGESREVWREIVVGREKTRAGVVIGKQLGKEKIIEVGVLKVRDFKTLMGLTKLWFDAGRPIDQPVISEFSELSQALNAERGKQDYKEHERSLRRLASIPVNWYYSFYQADTQTLDTIEDYHFHFLSELKFHRRSKRGKVEARTFTWKFHERILRNLIHLYTKPFYLDEVMRFSHEISVLCYGYFDLIMAGRTEFEITTKRLFEELQIEGVRYQKPSKRKQVLRPVVEELKGSRLSTGYLTTIRWQKTSKGKDWKLILHKRPFPKVISKKTPEEIQALVERQAEALGDYKIVQKGEEYHRVIHNIGFYTKIAKLYPEDPIHMALTDTEMEYRAGNIKTTKAKFYTYWIQELCKERGINLGLKSKS